MPREDDVPSSSTDREGLANEEYEKLKQMKTERDLKRRRQAYRRKVSTKNKTKIEIMREIIANTFECLGFYPEVGQSGYSTTDLSVGKIESQQTINPVNSMSPASGYDKFRFHRDYFEYYDRREDKALKNSEHDDHHHFKRDNYKESSKYSHRRESSHRRDVRYDNGRNRDDGHSHERHSSKRRHSQYLNDKSSRKEEFKEKRSKSRSLHTERSSINHRNKQSKTQ